jgi:5-methyltetrahydropteroyltriglutamate--homocysteine methyltransferase
VQSHVLGFPRIGARRELKKALESFWKGELSDEQLIAIGDELKQNNWRVQQDSGLSFVTTGDFSFYDHVLDTTVMLDAIPDRFRQSAQPPDLTTYFRLPRGDAAKNIPAMEMTKWFDTNYHYIVPEFTGLLSVRRSHAAVVDDTRHAVTLGYRPKPVLLGPISFLCLGKSRDGHSPWSHLSAILDAYCEVLADLSPLCEWIQIDEPVLCTDLPPEAAASFVPSLRRLKDAASGAKLLLASYFGELGSNLPLATQSGCDGLHLDLVRGGDQLDIALQQIPDSMTLSAGIIDGRNIWKANLAEALETLTGIEKRLGSDRILIGSSCSLLHVPVDLSLETSLDPEIRNWMSFAVQKCDEVVILHQTLAGKNRQQDLLANQGALESRRTSARVHRGEVRTRAASVTQHMLTRGSPYVVRKKDQNQGHNLPLLPTTTIGSFPQTTEIRSARLRLKRGEIDAFEYDAFLKNEIRQMVETQHELGLDVLVHGEPERNDMVEYFGEQLDGFCFTLNGWVQSYGSRCVKPPIIYGDISRPNPMTVQWITYAQSLTAKPMKGMLTGPVTILCWSFVRDDLPRREVCRQIALAIRDEVTDLEKAGVRIIQVDEAAWREGMPLRKSDADAYFRWAVDSFRLATAGVADSTQIHTHMCYSEFNAIIPWIAKMDADVISIESSRSGMELLKAFSEHEYPNEIGPGVYDIHSPRVPTTGEITELLRQTMTVFPPEQLWVNPDCGLKTRAWPETVASLRNMVAAAKQLRKEIMATMASES